MGVSVGWEHSVRLVLPRPHCAHRSSTEGPRMAVPAPYRAAAVSEGPCSGEGSSSIAPAVLLAALVRAQRWQFGGGLAAGVGSLLARYWFGVGSVLVQCWFDVGLMLGVGLVPVCCQLHVGSEPLRCHQGRFGAGLVPGSSAVLAVSSVSAQCHPAVCSVPSWCLWVSPSPPPTPPLRTPSSARRFYRHICSSVVGFRVFFPLPSLNTRRREPPAPTPRPHPAALSPSPLLPTPSYTSPSSPSAGTSAAAVPTCPAIGSPGCSCPR